MSPKLKIPLIMLGSTLVLLIFAFVLAGTLVARSRTPGGTERAAAKIGNFKAPKGFAMLDGIDMLIVSHVTLVPTTAANKMVIMLEGLYLPTNRDALDQAILASMKSNCSTVAPLKNDQIMVNGVLFTFRRVSCTDSHNPNKIYEYEFGSFVEKHR